MSIQKIIQESIAGNPLEMKEALIEELRARVRLALEAKMKDEDEDDEDDMKKEEVEQIDEASVKSVMGMHQVVHNGKPVATYVAKYEAQDHARQINDEERRNRKKKNESFDLSDYTVEELEDFMMSEDFDQLDEISKKTLASYVSKAADNAASKAVEYGAKKAQSDEMDRMMNRHMSYSDKDKVRGIMGTTSKDVNAPREKAAKRLAGISMAAKKLAKESFDLSDYTVEELEDFMMSEDFDQLDELDKKTLASYVKKASIDATMKSGKSEYEAGRAHDATYGGESPDHGAASRWRARSDKSSKTASNRLKGISRATDRLAK